MRQSFPIALRAILLAMVAWTGPTQAELPAPWVQAALLIKPSAVDPVLRMVVGPGEPQLQRAAVRACDRHPCTALGPEVPPAWL
ncbi:hypothetical protein [Xanthomonas arboricola]|uniref:Uncharacterized protein n=1 Tax=Xanthomonas arboricola pv. guizotiae TaxID=487867 RepID=A0A2S6ZT42_9XANT|nr:hypothetical protein [Xanthomonas arboricola]PPT95514.1 hypothetical protein XarbCFBP7409_17435 [Xanthomonas arboricola pv. guizotiae]PPU22825.1 hypothetical protein XarbCFBP7408_13655 [Xanthomonas arboricola pv. guizotiae]